MRYVKELGLVTAMWLKLLNRELGMNVRSCVMSVFGGQSVETKIKGVAEIFREQVKFCPISFMMGLTGVRVNMCLHKINFDLIFKNLC